MGGSDGVMSACQAEANWRVHREVGTIIFDVSLAVFGLGWRQLDAYYPWNGERITMGNVWHTVYTHNGHSST